MSQFLVEQLKFSRSEFLRCLEGVDDNDARKRLLPMNCISWIIGHLANQEHFYWSVVAQGKSIAPGLNDLVGFGKPASRPPLAEMWAVWQQVTTTADIYLDMLSDKQMSHFFKFNGQQMSENIGTMLLRNIHHYWFHIGEAHAIRQQLGHVNLPQFVGPMDSDIFKN